MRPSSYLKLLFVFCFLSITFSSYADETISRTHQDHLNDLFEKTQERLNDLRDYSKEEKNHYSPKKLVSYQSPGVLDFMIYHEKYDLAFSIDYNNGELIYDKYHNDEAYQSGIFYFDSKKINFDVPTKFKTEWIALNAENQKRNCSGYAQTLSAIMDLIDQLIENGVDPQSSIIGNLMQAGFSAFTQMMSCLQK